MMLKILFLLSILFFLSNACDDSEERSVKPFITVSNGGPWGSWGGESHCPRGSKAIGFSLKIEEHQWGADNTAMNGIRLHCSGRGGYVESKTGPWGDWTRTVWCPENEVLKAFTLNVEPHQYGIDDTAANNIKFKCSSGDILKGTGPELGSYEGWSESCYYGICGLKTKVEDRQGGGGDDTALNDVQFFCCSRSKRSIYKAPKATPRTVSVSSREE